MVSSERALIQLEHLMTVWKQPECINSFVFANDWCDWAQLCL